MSFLDRVSAFAPPDLAGYLPFRIAGHEVGSIRPAFARELEAFPAVFRVAADGVFLADGLKEPAARTEAVEGALRHLADKGLVPNWTGERYRVATAFSASPLFAIERAAVPLLGVRAYGVHVNGFVRDRKGIRMWIGKRAMDRAVAPGRFDQIVAGGQPAGLSVYENLIKECGEEASIPPALAEKARPVGAIYYTVARPEGLRRDLLFVHDLELPADFTPVNSDGEIESFRLLSLDEVAAIVARGEEFKFNCALVVIDFLIRHGMIAADDPDYGALIAGMHRWV